MTIKFDDQILIEILSAFNRAQHTKYQTRVNRMFIQVISLFSLSDLTGTSKIDRSEEDAVRSRYQALSSGGV